MLEVFPSFFLREPNILNFDKYVEVLGSHLIMLGTLEEDPSSSNELNNLQLCSKAYFIEYFTSSGRNTGGKKKQVKDSNGGGSRGWYLYKHYRYIRNEVFLEWERIFWRPSSTVTANCIGLFDPSVSTVRHACPSVLRKFDEKNWIFGISGKCQEDENSFSTIRIVLDENDNCLNPFNWFISKTHHQLEKVFQAINAILEKNLVEEDAFKEITNNFAIKFPSSKPLNIETLMKLGDFEFVLDFLCGYASILKKHFNDDQHTISIENTFHELREWLEISDMHIFLAAWTLWDKPQQPYIVNFLMRANDLESFRMLLTEEFLGSFYMVSFSNIIIVHSII